MQYYLLIEKCAFCTLFKGDYDEKNILCSIVFTI